MLTTRLLAAATIAALATGCAVGTDYHRPAAPLPERYIGQASAGAPLPAADLATWWNGFGDPLLARYVALAQDQNLDYAQAAARVRQARAGLGAAQAALQPSRAVTAAAPRAHQ